MLNSRCSTGSTLSACVAKPESSSRSLPQEEVEGLEFQVALPEAKMAAKRWPFKRLA